MDKKSARLIFGVLGFPVRHSLSPFMHNAAFSTREIDAEYKLFEVKPEDLTGFLDVNNLKEKNICGLNITIPHKIKAREILEKNFPFDKNALQIQQDLYYVKLSGAVNTIKREDDDKLTYYNTDASGFLRSLRQDLNFETKGKNVLLIGCGGAGRAVIAALSWKNKDTVANRIYVNDINEQAIASAKKYFSELPQWPHHLEEKLEFIPDKAIPECIKKCDLLVNATPVGMKEQDSCLVDEKILQKNLLVYDLIYNPAQTKLLRIARAKGCRVSNGLGMLLYQGAISFEIWTGRKAPVEVMRKALMEGLKR